MRGCSSCPWAHPHPFSVRRVAWGCLPGSSGVHGHSIEHMSALGQWRVDMPPKMETSLCVTGYLGGFGEGIRLFFTGELPGHRDKKRGTDQPRCLTQGPGQVRHDTL